MTCNCAFYSVFRSATLANQTQTACIRVAKTFYVPAKAYTVKKVFAIMTVIFIEIQKTARIVTHIQTLDIMALIHVKNPRSSAGRLTLCWVKACAMARHPPLERAGSLV